MMQSTCSIEGCDKRAQARTWCPKHYARWREHGDPNYVAPPFVQPQCSVDRCERTSVGRGLCGNHYRRLQVYGDPTAGRPVPLKKTCSVEGCQSQIYAKGACQAHYLAQRAELMGPCSVEGCEGTAFVGGLCQRHYSRKRRWGTTDDPEPTPGLTDCSVENCEATVKARGLCALHLQRLYRLGTTEVRPEATTKICSRCRRELPADAVTTSSRVCVFCRPEWHREQRAKVLPRTEAIRQRIAEIHAEQQGTCAICGTAEADAPKGKLHTDHIHGTLTIRGLLCGQCNSGLGMFKDSPDLLLAAIEYLKRTSPDAVSTLF